MLEKLRSFIDLSEAAKKLLCKAMKRRQLCKNECLLKEGQVCKSVYFIEYGCLRTYANKDEKEINLHFTLAGHFVTDLKSLREESVSEVYIQAMEPAAVWQLGKQSLFELYKESDEIVRFGRGLLEQLLSEQEAHGNMFKLRTPKERYLYIMQHRPELLQKVSLTQLASYLGMSRETLSRIRKP